MGTMVTDPIRRSAADLARAWLTLHHMTGGNVVLGIGSGEAMNTESIGQRLTRSVSRLDDALSALRAAFSAEGNPVTHSGPFHDWQGPKACEVAGRWGDGWIHIYAASLHSLSTGCRTSPSTTLHLSADSQPSISLREAPRTGATTNGEQRGGGSAEQPAR